MKAFKESSFIYCYKFENTGTIYLFIRVLISRNKYQRRNARRGQG